MLRFLVKHGADLNLVVEDKNCTPLQYAAKKGDISMVKLLQELGAEINGKPGEHGSTIHYALMSYDEFIARYFLDNGADVVDSSPGESTLCKALRFGMRDLMPTLLGKGADVNQREYGMTALGHAFKKDDQESVKLLLDHGATFVEAGEHVLLDAVVGKPLDDIRKLLEYGMDPNCHDTYQTPLVVSE